MTRPRFKPMNTESEISAEVYFLLHRLFADASEYLRDSMVGSTEVICSDGTTGRARIDRDPGGIEIAKWIVTTFGQGGTDDD